MKVRDMPPRRHTNSDAAAIFDVLEEVAPEIPVRLDTPKRKELLFERIQLAGASPSEDSNAKQNARFFDSIGHGERNSRRAYLVCIAPITVNPVCPSAGLHARKNDPGSILVRGPV